MIITDELARRLEYAEAADAEGCVEAALHFDPGSGAVAEALGGGYLTFCGAESPLTHAIGIGMHGPVTVEDIARIEAFFRSRGASVAIDVCPHADASLRDILSQRGYRITEFNNILVRALPVEQLPPAPSGLLIRTTQPDDQELYATTIVRGFFGRNEMTEAEYRLGQQLFRMPCTTCFLASDSGEVVGGGGLSMRNGIASFFGDATLREARGRQVQTCVIGERLRVASMSGCGLATAGTQPGSVSQHNYQKLGFSVAYSKATMVLDI